ncbi:hypothetical protein P0Y35_08655 [Kiritimatiellaeota bacterium B1221]|nr:hypothetical protein [Kiritimatiellaeota bacterium B1221]
MDAQLIKQAGETLMETATKAQAELMMKSEAAGKISSRIMARSIEIGELRQMPGEVLTEVSGISFLTQSLEEDLSLEDWTAETLENLIKTSVDLAAVATRLSEALYVMRLKRLALDKGSMIGDPFEGMGAAS